MFLVDYLANLKLLYSLHFSHAFYWLICLSLCLWFVGLFTLLYNYIASHTGLQNFLVSWRHSLLSEISLPFVGCGHVLGIHDVPSRNNAPNIESFLRSGNSWWLSIPEWLWSKHLQNGKRQWRTCLRQVPLHRKFDHVVIFSILSFKKYFTYLYLP
jgi:hypothetical protein